MKTLAHILAATLLANVAPAVAQTVAFFADLKGQVAVDSNPRPLLLSELARGQKLTLGANAQASVMYIATGKEFVLRGPGEYVVREADVASAGGAAASARETAWRASNKVLAQAAETSSASVRMRSLARPKVEPPPLAFPEGNVATLQPTFRWSGDARNGEFVLLADGVAQPVHVGKASSTTYKLPAKLKPETDYYWRVSAGPDQVASGRFRTLPAESIRTIEARRPGPKAEFSDRLLFALLLQDMGAQQEARDAWAMLSKERADLPELSALAK